MFYKRENIFIEKNIVIQSDKFKMNGGLIFLAFMPTAFSIILIF
jgi:hypothetical protein